MRILMLGLTGILLLACDRKTQSEPKGHSNVHETVLPNPSSKEVVTTAKVSEPKDPLKSADADMREVLEQLALLGGQPISGLEPVEARKQPSPADAVKKVLQLKGKSTTPLEVASVVDKKVPLEAGPIDARIYTPKTDAKKPLPVVVYWHGGGFVLANLDTYDASARALADESEAIVVALDYRHAPEAKFPAAHDDAFAGYQWVVKNAGSFGGDPTRIALAGESAGGNLAANVAIRARDQKGQAPLHLLLVYPVTQASLDTPSYQTWANARPLDRAMMEWFVRQYTKSPSDAQDARISLVDANLEGLPQTTIVNAEIDPLLSDGELLEKKLEAAQVDVARKTYEGVTHEFFGMGAVVGDAKDAVEWAGKRLKDALEK
jgi:acetyl esterase